MAYGFAEVRIERQRRISWCVTVVTFTPSKSVKDLGILLTEECLKSWTGVRAFQPSDLNLDTTLHCIITLFSDHETKIRQCILVALSRGLLPHGLQHRLHLLSFPEESVVSYLSLHIQSTKTQLPSFPLCPTICGGYYLIACVQNGESICVSRGQGRVINTFNRSWRIK